MIWQIFKLVFGVAWGAMENRCWKEAGDALILSHFKLYHAAMFALFAAICAIDLDFRYIHSWLLWLWNLLYQIVALDVTWWLIRFRDFCIDPIKAEEYYHEPNSWHLRTDWDNFLGLPLVFGVYWWWVAFVALLAPLGCWLLLVAR